MRDEKLSLPEKCVLAFYGRRDAKKGLIQRNADGCDASRIRIEQRTFNLQRSSLLQNKLVVAACVTAKGKKRFCVRRLAKALSLLDGQIGTWRAAAGEARLAQELSCRALQAECRTRAEGGAPHIVSLYEHRIEAEKAQADQKTLQACRVLQLLTGEKIRLLEQAEARLKTRQARLCLRIEYYFAAARSVQPDLPVCFQSEEAIRALCGPQPLGEYAALLDRAYRERAALEQFRPWPDTPPDAPPETVGRSGILYPQRRA